MNTVYISIGTNLGNRKKNIREALEKLYNKFIITKYSKPYKTLPYGYYNQPKFINMALEIKTDFSPQDVLNILQSIETQMGRIRDIKWGPRIIDLDILFFNDLIINTENLIIPHPDLHNRLFVLKPLMDICPDFIHPVLKKTIRELYIILKNN